ncbi:MAG: NADH-quinone oxidoreductase subunit M [Ktedonobacterales bacterium]
MTQFPILSQILFVPLLGMAGALVLPRRAAWGFALLAAVLDFALCVWLFIQFAPGQSGFQFAERQDWLPGFGVSYALGVDGINLFLVGLNALLTIVALAASWRYVRDGARFREYLAFMMLLSTGMQGVFLATNLFLFYVFWDLMLVPAYLLVGIFGGPRRTYAAIKFLLYTAIGSLLMLVAIIAVGAVVSATSHTGYNLDLAALLRNGVAALPKNTQIPLFLGFMLAFGIKSGLFPFHSWVPDAYAEAPVPVVVLIAGVMAKTGVYGMVRFCVTLFPVAARTLAPLMAGLAVAGILYFALQALVASDFMRLLAYVSISHMGVIILGIFALNAQGIEGGVIQMVNHGIIIAALFLIAGYIETRTQSRRLADFGGLAARLPWLATVFLIAALAALGLPGLNSFGGEFLAFIGAFRFNVVAGGLGPLVIIPAAWYMLRFFQGVMHGPERVVAVATGGSGALAGGSGASSGAAAAESRGSPITDLRLGEWATLLPLLVLIFFLGFVPATLSDPMNATVVPLTTAAAGTTAQAHATLDVNSAVLAYHLTPNDRDTASSARNGRSTGTMRPEGAEYAVTSAPSGLTPYRRGSVGAHTGLQPVSRPVRRPLWTFGNNDGHSAGLQPAQAGFVATGHPGAVSTASRPGSVSAVKSKRTSRPRAESPTTQTHLV